MTATESAYSEEIAGRLLDVMPEAISKLRPNSTFTYDLIDDDFEIFKEHPKKFHSIVQRGVKEACQGFWMDFKYRKYEGIIKKQMISKDKQNRFSKGLERFENIKVDLIFYPTVSMGDISPKIEREAIVVDGRIMAVSDKRGYLKEGSVYCPNECEGGEVMVYAGPTLRSFIPKCPDCKTKMHLRTSTAITEYVQTIKIQEIQQDNMEKQPITFDVKVVGDDVFNTWIGKRIRVAGHFLTDIVMQGNIQEHKQFIFSKYFHEIEEVENVCISTERAHEIRELLKIPENVTRLFKSFAPNIEGKLLQKEIIMYSFCGGSKSEVRRVDINALEIGNAGEGKSELIKQITRVIAKSRYFLGNNATAAGLGIGMVKLDNQTSVPQGGPLVLCSPHGTVAIDELDKMHPEDLKALLSSMEQQIVSKTVSGVDLVLPSKVSIISAANPKWGNWDTGRGGIAENINFPPYLLTRFDMVTCSVESNEIKKQAIAAKILGLDAITSEQSLTPLLSEPELLQYLNFCKKGDPRLTLKAKKELNSFYLKLSKLTEGEEKVVPMTPRELEGLIRLVTARAKLLQLKEVDFEEVEAIMRLKKDAMESFPGVTVTGMGQQLQLNTTQETTEEARDKIINSCLEDGTVDNVEVQKKWVEAGVYKNDRRAEHEFQQMILDRKFYLRGARYLYKL